VTEKRRHTEDEAGEAPKVDHVDRLLALFESDRPERRSAAAIVVGEIPVDTPEALEALRKALRRADDGDLRLRATEAIGRIGPKTLVKDLRPLLKDPDPRVQAETKRVLATSPAITTEEIAAMLAAKDDKQRIGAIAVLGARGGDKERRALIEQLDGSGARVVEAVLEALEPMLAPLGEMDGQRAVDDVRTLMTPERLAGEGLPLRVVDVLMLIHGGASAAALLDVAERVRSPAVSTRAIIALRKVLEGKKPEQRIFRFLLDRLEDDRAEPEVVAAAVETLTVFDVPIPLESRVRPLTTSPRANVRRWALLALGSLDTAPAAKALAVAVESGDATDRAVALEAALRTPNGRAAVAKALTTATDPEKARAMATGLKNHALDLTQSSLHGMEEAVGEAHPDVAQILIDLLKHCGRGVTRAQDTLLDKAMKLKAKGQFGDAAELFRRICAGRDADPEARYQLGVCELKLSKHKIGHGGAREPCVETFDLLTRSREFPVVERLRDERILEPDELYFLGFSLAEGKGGGQNLGGDILTVIAESRRDERLAQMAKNKLQRMGWLE
jgi:HEAT repeat protein